MANGASRPRFPRISKEAPEIFCGKFERELSRRRHAQLKSAACSRGRFAPGEMKTA